MNNSLNYCKAYSCFRKNDIFGKKSTRPLSRVNSKGVGVNSNPFLIYNNDKKKKTKHHEIPIIILIFFLSQQILIYTPFVYFLGFISLKKYRFLKTNFRNAFLVDDI